MKSTGGCRVIGYALEDANADAEIQVFAHLGEDSASELAGLRDRLDALTIENQELRQQLSGIETRLDALEQAPPTASDPRGTGRAEARVSGHARI